MRRDDRTKGERIADEAFYRNDHRERCDAEGHLVCTSCGVCACLAATGELDPTEYPSGTVRVTTDKQGRTGCRECRYQEDVLGNRRFGSPTF